MTLKTYRTKRDFSKTAEPKGARAARTGRAFVVQKHAATRLHYDLRLQIGDVLASWAVPKGPSLDPSEKRLAVQVEDHPLEYGRFEGTIPAGQYGGGTVMVWDRGTWAPRGNAEDDYRAGRLHFTLRGKKLRGDWLLLRMGGRKQKDKANWLLIKERDDEARRPADDDILVSQPDSAASGRTMEEIAVGRKTTRVRPRLGQTSRERPLARRLRRSTRPPSRNK